MILGICGGTGSGKTTVAESIIEALGEEVALLIAQDSYYKDNSHVPFKQRGQLNFDHPDSVDFALLIDHLESLRMNQSVLQPSYDFSQHTRKNETLRLDPRPVIVVEGFLIFQDQKLRALFDLKVFVDTESDVRILRRIRRDVRERGRTLDSVIQQYLQTVRPMHHEFVEPCKQCSDIIIPGGGKNPAAIDLLIQWVKSRMA